MASDNSGWKRFQRLRFDTKRFSRRARRAETATTRHARKFVIGRLAGIRDARNHIIRWMVLIVILIAAVATQMVWFQKTYTTEAAVAGGAYAEGVLGPIDTLNPLYATSSAELSACRLIFSGLYTYDTSGHLQTDMASGMSVDKTGEVYTIHLRPNLKWQDGHALTAEDIVFTVNLMKNPQTRATMGPSWQTIIARAINDSTVQFQLPAPYAAFPDALTFSVLPQHILGDVAPGSLRESTFSLSPVGSGPFKLQLLQTVSSSNERKVAYLNPWDGYYGGQPKVHRFELHSYKNPNDIVRALTIGDVNAATDISNSTKKIPKAFLHESIPVDNGVYTILNTTSPILKDKSVRQALQLGTDTSAIRQNVSPQSPVLDLPFISDQINGNNLPKKPAYNLVAASRLLDKAGWRIPPGKTIRQKRHTNLELRVVTTKNHLYEKTLKLLKAQWLLLGVDVKAETYDANDTQQNFAQTVLQPRNYDVLINELVIGADPDVFAFWHSSQSRASVTGLNFSNYNNPISDDILLSARGRSSDELRNEKYKAFARQWLSDAPAIGLYQSVMEYAHNSDTSALSPNMRLVSPTDRYSNVLYWTADRGQVYKTP